MLVAWIATIYGLWQLIELHEIKGRRFNRYHELGQYALGKPHQSMILAACLPQITVESKIFLPRTDILFSQLICHTPLLILKLNAVTPADPKAQCCPTKCQHSMQLAQ